LKLGTSRVPPMVTSSESRQVLQLVASNQTPADAARSKASRLVLNVVQIRAELEWWRLGRRCGDEERQNALPPEIGEAGGCDFASRPFSVPWEASTL
jgi:hypothetical protein